MNTRKTNHLVLPAMILFSFFQGSFAKPNLDNHDVSMYTTGMADIDRIRGEMATVPTTSENAKSRHAALNRWWRLLWRQGYEMSSFDTTAKILLRRSEYSDAKLSPTVTSERVIFKTGRSKHAFDKKSGKRMTGQEIDKRPKAKHEQIVVWAGRNRFRLEDANTEKAIRWYETEQTLLGQPVLFDGKIFASCKDGMVYAYRTDSPDLLWKAKLDGTLRVEVEIGTDLLYAGSYEGRLFALNVKDGNVLWTYTNKKEKNNSYRYYSKPCESKKRLYVGTAGSELLCINNTNGDLLWKLNVSDWIRSRPLLVQGTIHVATLGGDIFAIRDNGNSAEIIKRVHLGDHVFSIDLTGNENGILATSGGMMLYSVAPTTLKINWKHGILDGAWVDGRFFMADWTGGLQPSPTVVDGILYSGGMDGYVFALDAESGQEIWRFETGGSISAAITVAEGKVFFGEISGERNYYALDKNTGRVIWQTNTFKHVWVGASYTNQGLFFGNMEGMMYGVNPKDGRIIWSYDTAKDTPKENWRHMRRRGHGIPPGIYSVPVADETKVYILC